jgi:formamidopyrimidine-DNA glycosylase
MASLHRETATEEPGRDTHLAVTFTIGGAIHLSDSAREPDVSTGVVPTSDAMEAAGLSAGAFDPLDDNITWMEFGERLAGAARPLKMTFMDPTVIAGIGTVYSDEILWAAGLRYDREASSLTTQDVRRLHRALLETLHDGVKYRGVSQPGDAYVDYYGKPGGFGNELKVVGREGQPCRRCRQKVVKSRYANKFTYHCGSCQV